MRLEGFVVTETPPSFTIWTESPLGECSSPSEASTSHSDSLLQEPSHLVIRDLTHPRRPLGELSMIRPASRSETSSSLSSDSTREPAPDDTVQLELHQPSHGVIRNWMHPRRPLGDFQIFRSASRSEASTPLYFGSDRESSPDRRTQQAQLEFMRMRLRGFVVTETPLSSTMRRASSSGKHSSPSEDSSPRSVKISRESVDKQGSVRESHFALALARMEGRAAPTSFSPIQRRVHPEGLYSDEVLLEHHGPAIICPRPVSWTKERMIQRLLQDETDCGTDGLDMYEFPMLGYTYERPGNPTPERAIFHNDELEVLGFVEKAKDW
ncbi:hypothetical protein MMC07_001539 [Pseudocyphellaria aurata]|nr:hypothetical protein [Pseudocyphellaria aurata]